MFIDMMIAMMIFTAGYIVYCGKYYEEVAGMIGGAGGKIRDWRRRFERRVSEKGVSEKSEKMGMDEEIDGSISESVTSLDVEEDVEEDVVSIDARIRDVTENNSNNNNNNNHNFEILSASAVPTPLPTPLLPPPLPPPLLDPQKTTAEPSEDTEQQEQQQEQQQKQQPQTDCKMTALGYIDDPKGDRLFVIPEKDRQNIGIFGEIGSGKTSVLRLLIMQDIIRKTGFLLIDPHREFSREVLSMIPRDMQHKVVYVSLASLYQFGRTVCINPLQTQTDHEKYIRTAGCIDNLKQYFSDGWGHRLETILRNMINLVMSTPDTFKFLDIIKILFDVSKRNQALQKCTNPVVRDFWTNVFPKFASEASGAIYNKFDKIINTPPIAAIFSSVVSTISIRDIIEDSKIVVVDLGSAATVDIIEFVGTLLINMFNLENKIRFDLGDARKVPFNIYIDEVHMFSAQVIRELLNNVRKYDMKVTVATQSIKVLDESLAKELDDLFRCMVMFRCDAETGRLLARNLPLNEQQLAQLSFHRFAAFSQGFQRVSGIGKTKHVQIPSRWRQVAQESLERYGKEIPVLSEGSLGPEKVDRTVPKLSPLEYFVLNMLYLHEGRVKHKDIVSSSVSRFGVHERAVNTALIDSLLQHHHYVVRDIDYRQDRKKFDADAAFAITKLGMQSIYSRAFAGPGAGGQLHTGVISAIADAQVAQYHYCIVDLGDAIGSRADIIIYEFRPLKDTKTARARSDPDIWSNSAIAVEVETDPGKHRGQVVTNYEKNVQRGMDVWFVVFTQRHKEYIEELMNENSITQYEIAVVDPNSIDVKNRQQDLLPSPSSPLLPLHDAVDDAAAATAATAATAAATKTATKTKTAATPEKTTKPKKGTYLRASQVFAVLESIEIKDGAIHGVLAGKKQEREELDKLKEYEKQRRAEEEAAVDGGIGGIDTLNKKLYGDIKRYKNIETHTLFRLIKDDDTAYNAAIHKVLRDRGYTVIMRNDNLELRKIPQDKTGQIN